MATIYYCDCESKIWIFKVYLKNLKNPTIWTFEIFSFFLVKKTKNIGF